MLIIECVVVIYYYDGDISYVICYLEKLCFYYLVYMIWIDVVYSYNIVLRYLESLWIGIMVLIKMEF